MSNEEIVINIQSGIDTVNNSEWLYNKNLKLIKMIIKPYTTIESEEDLLQESFFGLLEAIKHYETDRNVKFMTYAEYWIKQACLRYIETCGRVVRIPTYIQQDIIRYKKALLELSQKLCRYPEDKEIAEFLGITESKLNDLKMYEKSAKSLNEIYSDEDGAQCELINVIQDDFRLEDSVIDNLYEEHCKNELWDVVGRYTSNRECDVLHDRFKNQKTLKTIANKYGISFQCVRDIERGALRKLRRPVARKELEKKFDLALVSAYRTGVSNFKTTWESSTEKSALLLLDCIECENKIWKELC